MVNGQAVSPELAPEEEKQIEVSFNSAGKSGQVMQSVIITYEHEGETVALNLPIRGYMRMQPSYYIRERIDFGHVRRDSGISRTPY